MGGGGSKQKQTINEKIMSDIASSVAAKIQQNCAARVTAEQVIEVAGDNNVVMNVVQKGFFSIDASCKITQEIMNELIAELSSKMTAVMDQNRDALSKALKDSLAGITGGKDKVKQEMNRQIELVLHSELTAEVVQNCAASIESKQHVLVSGSGNVISGVTQDMMSNVSLQCLSNNAAVNKIKSNLFSESAYTQEYKEAGPFDWLSDIMSDFWNVVLIIFILLVLLGFIYMLSRGKMPPGLK
jgi:hypothetical protein